MIARRAFTLLELLVAVGVIAVLAAILAPSLSGARATARTQVCASNIRQLALANDLFASDHQSRYAPGAAQFLANRRRWHGERALPTGAFDPSRAPLAPYLGDPPAAPRAPADARAGGASVSARIRECPSFAETLDTLTAARFGFESSCGGYGYNNAFVGVERAQIDTDVWDIPSDRSGAPRDTLGSPRHRFAQPARTVAFTDSALAHARSPARHEGDRVIEYSFAEPPRWPHWPDARPDPSIHFRHGTSRSAGRANAAWLDGHVSAEPMARSWTSGLYTRTPARLIGWFGADSNELFDYD